MSLDTEHRRGNAEAVLRRVLDRCALDRPARDGDCVTVAPRVTAQLRAEAVEASTVTLFGWLDEPAGILAFVHTATIARGYVLDGTASQFGAHLPNKWVVPIEEYLDRLAAATGVQRVTVDTGRCDSTALAGGCAGRPA